MELDERKEKILKAIIQTYLETGEPVGSRTISKYSGLKLSSATIRNEMSDLRSWDTLSSPIRRQDGSPLIRDTGSMWTRSSRKRTAR